MTEANSTIRERFTQYRPIVLLCLCAIAAVWILQLAGSQAFRPFYGDHNPVIATALVAVVGVASAIFLDSRGCFAIHRKGEFRRGVIWSLAVTALLAMFAIMVDFFGGFPRELNVSVPQSLLFYPVAALHMELAAHVAPLALLILTLGPVLKRMEHETIIWTFIVIVSLIEPSLQVFWGSDKSPPWANAYVGLHIFVFNLLELYVFKRYGFISMFTFRVSYYAFWHIVWGYLRLQFLF